MHVLKTRSLLLGLGALGLAPLLLALTYSYGAPPGLTGAPRPGGNFEGTCAACHSSYELNSGSGSVTIEGPDTYAAGETVMLTITVDNTTPLEGSQKKQGFQFTVKDEEAEHVGTLAPSSDGTTQGIGGNPFTHVTHTSPGSLETSWTVSWTAPVDEPPTSVTAYAVGNATNGNRASVGDYVYTTSFTMTLRGVDAEPAAVPAVLSVSAPFPNPLPATQALTVPFVLDAPREVTLTLYDALGRVVASAAPQTYAAGEHAPLLAPGQVPAGVHFVTVEVDGERTMRAISILH
ncbi:MAG: choice-of-anchor V domain-containing protein [Bacteroidota bacterium]